MSGPPHSFALMLLHQWLASVFGFLSVRVQLPLRIREPDGETNEPEPDIAVTSRSLAAYPNAHPTPEDLLLLVEVSDTTLEFDRTTKAALYARHGVPDYWAVDLQGRCVCVHRQPTPQGFREVALYEEAESLSPLARPDQGVRVSDLLPEPATNPARGAGE